MTLKVNDNETCTIESTDEEASLLGLKSTVTFPKANIPIYKNLTMALPSLRVQKAELENKLANSERGTVDKAKLTSQLEKITKRITTVENFDKALDACAAGKGYGPNNPQVPNHPDDSSKPGPNNPQVPNNPQGERALPSTNGAVIGAIVAVLGILAAALPVIKSILRALLP
ncbi:hypothetical protein CIP107555_01814 [Corynebacterium diphtheriae]|nr:hypothetical protein CIP107555_01814 [Corynebacterium diphtheriae]